MAPPKANTPGGQAEGVQETTVAKSNYTSGSGERFGAMPDEWQHFVDLGLAVDLLPVVSNPNAPLAPYTTLPEDNRGKVPSRYNSKGEVHGFPKWTEHHATSREIDAWSEDSDYGICLKTNHVRAIDVDINDVYQALDVEGAITDFLGYTPPARRRRNSSKFLFAVIVEGEMPKRKFSTSTNPDVKDAIEFLANGQQCIVAGLHPSGVRYEWTGGLPNSFPVLEIAEFEALWAMLNEKFGIEPSVTVRKGMTPEKRRLAADANDSTVLYLVENWTVYGIQKDGRVDILCPFAANHTGGVSEGSSTSYYPAGVGGFASGHYKCHHASCAGRTDQDFNSEIGVNANGFDIIEIDASAPQVLPPPKFETSKSSGKATRALSNVVNAIRRPDICGYQLRFDEFRHGVMLSPPGVDEWRALKDEDYTELRLRLSSPGLGHDGFEEVGKENIRDAVHFVADKSKFDSAILWLESKKWDGVPRVEHFLPRYFGTADTPYTRAIGLYLWTALAGRVMAPGIKADMVPVAVGIQGSRKSSAVEAISPAPDFFTTLDLAKGDDDLARLMRGKLIIELGELRGLRKKEVNHLKDFIVRKKEEWTPKYFENNTTFMRRCVFFGTTNQDQFLVDETGNRRWLPFDAGQCDPDGIAAARDQLWAEALALFNQNGILWEQAETLAEGEHAKYTEAHEWEETVVNYLTTEQLECEGLPIATPFTSVELLHKAIQIPISKVSKTDKDSMGSLLKRLTTRLNLCKFRPYINGVQQWAYVLDEKT